MARSIGCSESLQADARRGLVKTWPTRNLLGFQCRGVARPVPSSPEVYVDLCSGKGKALLISGDLYHARAEVRASGREVVEVMLRLTAWIAPSRVYRSWPAVQESQLTVASRLCSFNSVTHRYGLLTCRPSTEAGSTSVGAYFLAKILTPPLSGC